MRQDIREYKLQLQTQRNMMVSRAEDTDITNKLMKKNKDLAEAMEELQVCQMPDFFDNFGQDKVLGRGRESGKG